MTAAIWAAAAGLFSAGCLFSWLVAKAFGGRAGRPGGSPQAGEARTTAGTRQAEETHGVHRAVPAGEERRIQNGQHFQDEGRFQDERHFQDEGRFRDEGRIREERRRQEERRLREEQAAFRRVANYSAEDAYGRTMEAWGEIREEG